MLILTLVKSKFSWLISRATLYWLWPRNLGCLYFTVTSCQLEPSMTAVLWKTGFPPPLANMSRITEGFLVRIKVEVTNLPTYLSIIIYISKIEKKKKKKKAARRREEMTLTSSDFPFQLPHSYTNHSPLHMWMPVLLQFSSFCSPFTVKFPCSIYSTWTE